MPKYVILQENGVESDPLSGSEVLRWVQEGRIQRSTLIRGVGARKWYQAKDIPQIAAVLGVGDLGVLDDAQDDGTETIPFADSDGVDPTPDLQSHTDPELWSLDAPPVESEADWTSSPSQEGGNTARMDGNIPEPAPKSSESSKVGDWLVKCAVSLASRVLLLLFGVIPAILILYFSGWSLHLGNESWLEAHGHAAGILDMDTAVKRFVAYVDPGWGFIDKYGVAVTVNKQFYGIGLSDRFFLSPFIQWVGLMIAIPTFLAGVAGFFSAD